MLDEDYYGFILSGVKSSDGLQLVTEEHLIPLKAKAHLDLLQRKKRGEQIDSKDIRKHKNDVFRLFRILTPESSIALPESIARNMREFLELAEQYPPDLKQLGIKTLSPGEVIGDLRNIYNLDNA